MSLWKSRGMGWLVGSVGALFDVNNLVSTLNDVFWTRALWHAIFMYLTHPLSVPTLVRFSSLPPLKLYLRLTLCGSLQYIVIVPLDFQLVRKRTGSVCNLFLITGFCIVG
jgi:hypothetical protein